MGILIHGEARPTLAFAANERPGYFFPFSGFGIGVFERPHDQGTDGGAGTLGAEPQPIVERFRKIDGGSHGHAMIMSQLWF